MALTTIVYWLHLSHLKKKNTENRQNSGSTLNRVFCSKISKMLWNVETQQSSRTRGWRHQLTILVARNLFPESRTSLLTKNREPTMFIDDLSVKVGASSVFSMYIDSKVAQKHQQAGFVLSHLAFAGLIILRGLEVMRDSWKQKTTGDCGSEVIFLLDNKKKATWGQQEKDNNRRRHCSPWLRTGHTTVPCQSWQIVEQRNGRV